MRHHAGIFVSVALISVVGGSLRSRPMGPLAGFESGSKRFPAENPPDSDSTQEYRDWDSIRNEERIGSSDRPISCSGFPTITSAAQIETLNRHLRQNHLPRCVPVPASRPFGQ